MSYSADSSAWSNNFNTIFWSDDASGSWLPVVLNRWYDNTKKSHELFVCNWSCHCLHIIRNKQIFFSIRYNTGLISPSLSLTRQLVFNMLIHHVWTVVLARNGSLFLVCSTSQLVLRLILDMLVACAVSRQTVKQSTGIVYHYARWEGKHGSTEIHTRKTTTFAAMIWQE